MSDYIEIDGIKMAVQSKKQEFGTGSIRDNQAGKIRYDFISPIFLKGLATWCTLGALKYAPRNWEKGQPLHQYVASIWRHLMAFMEGRNDEPHLVAVAWNIMAYMHTEQKCLSGALPEILLTAGLNQKYTEEEYEKWAFDQTLDKK